MLLLAWLQGEGPGGLQCRVHGSWTKPSAAPWARGKARPARGAVVVAGPAPAAPRRIPPGLVGAWLYSMEGLGHAARVQAGATQPARSGAQTWALRVLWVQSAASMGQYVPNRAWFLRVGQCVIWCICECGNKQHGRVVVHNRVLAHRPRNDTQYAKAVVRGASGHICLCENMQGCSGSTGKLQNSRRT